MLQWIFLQGVLVSVLSSEMDRRTGSTILFCLVWMAQGCARFAKIVWHARKLIVQVPQKVKFG